MRLNIVNSLLILQIMFLTLFFFPTDDKKKNSDEEDPHHSFIQIVAVLLGVFILGVVIFSTCAACTTKNGYTKKGGRIAAAEGTGSMLGHGHSSRAIPHTNSSAGRHTEHVSEAEIEKFVVLRGIPGMELARGELAQLWKITELELRLHIMTASMRLGDLTWLIGTWKLKIKDQELLKFDLEKQQKSRDAEEVPSQSHLCHEKGTFYNSLTLSLLLTLILNP